MKIKTCIPQKMPPLLNWELLMPLSAQAHTILGRFDGLLQSVPYPKKIFSILTTYEALQSLRSQDFRTTLEEILEYEMVAKRREVVQHVINYHTALLEGIAWIKRHPFSLNFIKKTHASICKSSPKSPKDIGHFRKRQNWIGPKDCTFEEALYHPPAPNDILGPLKDLESYINSDEKDPIIHMGIIMGQFLTIHPFMDGNGRLARLFIPLFLWKKGVITHPLFYLSSHFQNKRVFYFRKLFSVTNDKQWQEWLMFFLESTIQEGKKNTRKVKNIAALFYEVKEEILEITKKEASERAAIRLFESPLFTKSAFVEGAHLPKATGLKILAMLKRKGYITKHINRSVSGEELFLFKKLILVVKKNYS